MQRVEDGNLVIEARKKLGKESIYFCKIIYQRNFWSKIRLCRSKNKTPKRQRNLACNLDDE